MSETGKAQSKFVLFKDVAGNTVAVNPTQITHIAVSPVQGATDVHTTGGIKHTIVAAVDDVIKLIEDGLAIWAGLGL